MEIKKTITIGTVPTGWWIWIIDCFDDQYMKQTYYGKLSHGSMWIWKKGKELFFEISIDGKMKCRIFFGNSHPFPIRKIRSFKNWRVFVSETL